MTVGLRHTTSRVAGTALTRPDDFLTLRKAWTLAGSYLDMIHVNHAEHLQLPHAKEAARAFSKRYDWARKEVVTTVLLWKSKEVDFSQRGMRLELAKLVHLHPMSGISGLQLQL